jgi:hypothetical protein
MHLSHLHLLFQELSELYLLQHVHYVHSLATSIQMYFIPHPGVEHILQPFSIVNMIMKETTFSSQNLPTSSPTHSEDAEEDPDVSDLEDGHPMESRRGNRLLNLTKLCNIRLLAFAPVQITLQQVLDCKHFLIPPALAVEFCQQMLLAVDHLIAW